MEENNLDKKEGNAGKDKTIFIVKKINEFKKSKKRKEGNYLFKKRKNEKEIKKIIIIMKVI